ncbi:MAG: hypothetical protein IIU17_05290, partial [Muribaculaceae bacterium]|nr:hypothetical protein [Muribaculaceae bacterium]
MKRILLFSLTAVITVISGMAVTDNQSYEPVNGINVRNLWMLDRVHAKNAYTELPICHTNART